MTAPTPPHTLADVDAELARRSLREFIRQAWPIIEPGTPYLDNWHVHAICDYLEAVTRGEVRRLIINIPPRHMKTITVSIMWPVWEWIQRPACRWMFASFAQGLSNDASLKRRDIIQSDWYQRHWADRYQLVSDLNVKSEYKNDHQGVMFATSMGGTTTGKGGNRIVVDDPHSASQGQSDAVRPGQNTFFDNSLFTRQNDKKRDAIVVVMQRLHERDLTGHLLAKGGYEHLCLPAEAAERTVISVPSAEYVREAGSLLWPEKEGVKELAEAKLTLGEYGYAGQYGQSPAPAGGGKFKEAWFRYYRRDGDLFVILDADGRPAWSVPVEQCRVWATMDPAGSDAAEACYTVIQVWAETPSFHLLLLAQYREQVESPDAAEAAVRWSRDWECEYIGIEKDGIGLGTVQTVRKRGVTVRPIKARGSKVARAETAQIRMAAGMILFPESAPFLFDLRAELLTFPNTVYKDQVDALAHAAILVQKSAGPPTTAEDAEHETADAQRAELDAGHPGAAVSPAAVTSGAADGDDEAAAWLRGE